MSYKIVKHVWDLTPGEIEHIQAIREAVKTIDYLSMESEERAAIEVVFRSFMEEIHRKVRERLCLSPYGDIAFPRGSVLVNLAGTKLIGFRLEEV